MPLTIDELISEERTQNNILQAILYLPFGIILFILRCVLLLFIWVATIILPDKSSIRQKLSTLSCWVFGVYVKMKGKRDTQCSVLVANYVSCLDSLATSYAYGAITLTKWNVPPFLASTLGVKNATQFVKKLHFTDGGKQPVMVQPEGGGANGKGLLQFTEWPFPINSPVQPLAISCSRRGRCDGGPWAELARAMFAPLTAYTLHALPPAERADDRPRRAIADALQVELTDYTWEEVKARVERPPAPRVRRPPPQNVATLVKQVREVLPNVPEEAIRRDLLRTRNVDVTITNFLEGITPYVPEPTPIAASSTKYVTPSPTGVFAKNAKERQLSFQERKAKLIADARQRYLEKHGIPATSGN